MQNNQPLTTHQNDDLKFLINCCQTDLNKKDLKAICSYLNTEHLDFNALIGIANKHGILPLVYKTLKHIVSVSTETPSGSSNSSLNAFLSDLKPLYMSIVQKNMLMTSELLRIMKLLRENGVEALAFKGPALSKMAYGDITLRQYSDLDILVAEKEVSKAGSVLAVHGYDPAYPIKILKNKTCLSATNDLGFYNQSSNVLIELHWKLFREKIGKHLHFSQIYENKQNIIINSKTLPTLSNEILLVYLCLHGSKHAWERIEWICDIDRLVRSQTDLNWDKILKTAKEMDTAITLYLGLALSHMLFHTPVPKSITPSTQTAQIKALVEKTFELLDGPLAENEGYAKYNAIHKYQMDLLDTKLKKLKHLFSTYFGVSRNDCQSFLLPSSLKFLYLLIKPFRVIAKYIQYGK